jgi:hypothetical protein
MLIEKLGVAERTELLQEIQGNRPPQLPLHLQQMREHGIFSAVAEAIQAEIDAARAALAPWSRSIPVPGLLALCDAIADQVDEIRPV